jgi:hypothetical protein
LGILYVEQEKKGLKKVKINLPNPKTPLEFKISKVMYRARKNMILRVKKAKKSLIPSPKTEMGPKIRIVVGYIH